MTDQIGTPGSTADTSVNEGKVGAPKDKACPFCNQAFTSSSLGRHLDLYVKEKNPKPADGIHDVVEIRKMRGGITRRQPRSSTSKRDDSTPGGTPGPQDRRSPPPEQEMGGKISPSLRRESGVADVFNNNGKPLSIHQASWEATGVINNIPMGRNVGSVASWDAGEDRDAGRRSETRDRSVSKHILAKTTFEQKQKMVEALDNAKAAELALRELLGSLRAAKQRLDGPSVFDYDPLTYDFPALTLHCLPPPPTLSQSTPMANSISWSILPPDEMQYQALRSHFSSEFRRYRINCAIATTAPRDDLSYPPPLPSQYSSWDDPSELAQHKEAEASALEAKIDHHLHQMFAHWMSLSPQKRSEIWTLELARSIGRKTDEVVRLKKDKEMAQQETEHLRLQVDELSRLQQPREFRLAPPHTIPIQRTLISEAGEMGLRHSSVGFTVLDCEVHLDEVIERAIGRWKGVVKEARGAGPKPGGLSGQRSLSGESSSTHNSHVQVQTTQAPPQNQRRHLSPSKPTPLSNSNPGAALNPNIGINHTMTNGNEIGSDEDADADADMEDDDSFEANNMNINLSRAPEAQMAQANFRLSNGNERTGIEGLDQTCVSGYVRISAS